MHEFAGNDNSEYVVRRISHSAQVSCNLWQPLQADAHLAIIHTFDRADWLNWWTPIKMIWQCGAKMKRQDNKQSADLHSCNYDCCLMGLSCLSWTERAWQSHVRCPQRALLCELKGNSSCQKVLLITIRARVMLEGPREVQVVLFRQQGKA